MKNKYLYSLTSKKLSAILAVIIGVAIVIYLILESIYGNSKLLNMALVFSILIPAVLARFVLFYVDYKKQEME